MLIEFTGITDQDIQQDIANIEQYLESALKGISS